MTETATYIRKLTIENVRCFGRAKQELNLVRPDGRPHQWTVILGENGTGKTTLLQCIASVIVFQREFNSDDSAFDSSRILTEFPNSIWRKSSTDEPLQVKLLAEYSPNLEAATGSRLIQGYWRMQSNVGHVDEDFDLQMIAGYGAMRRTGIASLKSDKVNNSLSSLFLVEIDVRNAEEWLLQLDYSSSKDSNLKEKFKDRLKLVIELLVNILPDIENVRITTPTEENPFPSVEFQTPDGWLPIEWIGYGYRSLVAWMVDFASRMVECYPDSKDPLKEPAVVLVDEIDLHLHPKWQRELMGYLSERFPNTQFIVSAHSPIFVQAAENANLVVLRRDKEKGHVVIENDPVEIRGWRLDQILTSDLFGLPSARSPEVEKLQEERVSILSKPKLTASDEKRVAELEEKMGGLPAGESAAEVKTKQLLDRVLQSLQQIPNVNQPGASEAT